MKTFYKYEDKTPENYRAPDYPVEEAVFFSFTKYWLYTDFILDACWDPKNKRIVCLLDSKELIKQKKRGKPTAYQPTKFDHIEVKCILKKEYDKLKIVDNVIVG